MIKILADDVNTISSRNRSLQRMRALANFFRSSEACKSLVDENEGLHLPIGKTNLVIVLHELFVSLRHFMLQIITLAYASFHLLLQKTFMSEVCFTGICLFPCLSTPRLPLVVSYSPLVPMRLKRIVYTLI